MVKTETENLGKKLNELALNYSRSRQSPQTGYIHYHYGTQENDSHDTIPLSENFYFCLTLLQSRTSENILEARKLLEQLLAFQTGSGQFPVYLHDFPVCRDSWLASAILPPLFWILKNFSSVLGTELKEKLEVSVKNLFTLPLKNLSTAPYHLGIKVAAAAAAFGKFFHWIEIKSLGDQWLNHYYRNRDLIAWHTPAQLGDCLIALQMVYEQISHSQWHDFWLHLSQTWHGSTQSYVGPGIRELQEESEPQPTLYDLFLGYFSGSLSERALKPHPFHFYSSIIRPTEDKLAYFQYPLITSGFLLNQHYYIQQFQDYAVSTLDFESLIQPEIAYRQMPFKLVWGKEKAHSIVYQNQRIQGVVAKPENNSWKIHIRIPEPYQGEEKEKAREAAFYVSLHDNLDIHVNGQRATTFNLNDMIRIKDNLLSVSLKFELKSGSGDFLGHIMRGNRPAQIAAVGKNKFEVFDWIIFLRTLRRTDPCEIVVHLSIEENYS